MNHEAKIILGCITIAFVFSASVTYIIHNRFPKSDEIVNIAQAKGFRQDTYQGAVSKTPKPKYGMADIESVCLDGVKYYILTSHRGGLYETCITPALMRNGRPVPCGDDLYIPGETR